MLELDIIKQHVRLELDDDSQDSLLESYAGAAWDQVQAQTGRTLYPTKQEIPVDDEGEPTDDHALVLNDALTTAMLLMIGHWFENRESVVIGTIATELPMAVNSLIKPYQHFNV